MDCEQQELIPKFSVRSPKRFTHRWPSGCNSKEFCRVNLNNNLIPFIPVPELSFLPAPYRGTLFLPARVQPLYGAGRKESSGTGLNSLTTSNFFANNNGIESHGFLSLVFESKIKAGTV